MPSERDVEIKVPVDTDIAGEVLELVGERVGISGVRSRERRRPLLRH